MSQPELAGAVESRLRNLDGVKWAKYGPDVLPAWVADMDFEPPAEVIAAVQAPTDRRDFGYNFSASQKVPAAFADWQQRRHGWSPDPERVALFTSVLHAIDTILYFYTEPGDGIVLFTPIYPPFRAVAEHGDRRLIDCPLDPDGWRLDLDVLRSVIDDRTTAILLCNPHNPTGRVFTDAELAGVLEVAAEHDLLVLSDEIWADLVHPGVTHRPLASLSAPGADQVVTFGSASKSFNLAGMRVGVVHVGSDRVNEMLDALPSHFTGMVSVPGAEATLAAWRHGEPWLETLKAHLTAQRDHLAQRLAAEAPEVGFTLPEATYLTWLDLRAWDLGDDPAKALLKEAQIALGSGADFGPNGEGWVRLNLSTSRDILDRIIDRMLTLRPAST